MIVGKKLHEEILKSYNKKHCVIKSAQNKYISTEKADIFFGVIFIFKGNFHITFMICKNIASYEKRAIH